METPVRKVTFDSPYGGDGDIPFDEEGYHNTVMNLNMYVEGGPRTASNNREIIFNWFNSGKYMDFIPYFDPDKVYKVMTTTPPKFTSVYYMGEGQIVEVGLTVKPYKYFLASSQIVLTAASSIFNHKPLPSQPKIKIYGSGNITLTINGVPFVMKGVIGHIVLDSQLGIAYNEETAVLVNENRKVYTRNYPVLSPGSNNISWTGTVTSIEIDPRWRTLT